MSYGLVDLATNTAASIVTANSQRISLIITNIGSSPAYLGDDASVTSANGVLIVANGTLSEDSGGTRMYMGEYFAIAGSASTQLTYWQRTRGSG